MGLFDGLAKIFTETFGDDEGVQYKILATGAIKTIKAIWSEQSPMTVLDGFNSRVDGRTTELHVALADIPAPSEGDLVKRLKTGVTGKVVAPFRPDDKGMIALPIERDDIPRSTL